MKNILKMLVEAVTNSDRIKELQHELTDYQGQVQAIGRSQAVIEFELDGTIITANDKFLDAIGYQLDEIVGKKHAMFVDKSTASGTEYKQFWESLNRGEYQSRGFKRIGKGGKEVWIQASYNPIMDEHNRPFKIVKYATDITEVRLKAISDAAQIEAIHKSQAVIEFNMDGTIITANNNFLKLLDYELGDIKGKHHSIFADSAYASSSEYRAFWAALNKGQYQSGEFMRLDSHGEEVWIQASYNPIMDLNKRPYKVVKFASDISEQKRLQTTVELIFEEVSKVMLSLADGKVDNRVDGDYTGQFEVVKNAVNSYCKKIHDVVLKIRKSSQMVSDGAEEISRGSINLSHRTEAQSESLLKTSASIEEMTTSVKLNADHAKEANDLARSASEQASTGGEVVNKAISAMSEINQASNKIADIIGVIDEIAFQTNLLALNAAVEAARAGEQGRGFAVVATEVRNLAGRSATAAKEIKDLIEDSVKKVTDGSYLVNQSGETLEQIMDSVRQVADIVGNISSATQEQALGVDQVNTAIIGMDAATQQNTALVEEAAAAAEAMFDQSNELNSLVSFFQVEEVEGSESEDNLYVKSESRGGDRPWENVNAESIDVEGLKMVAGSDVTNEDWDEF